MSNLESGVCPSAVADGKRAPSSGRTKTRQYKADEEAARFQETHVKASGLAGAEHSHRKKHLTVLKLCYSSKLCSIWL